MEKHHKFSIWYVLLGVWVVLLIQGQLGSMLAIKTIPYSQFLDLVKENRVTEVAISVNQIQGKMKADKSDPNKVEPFRTLRVDPEISTLLDKYGVTFKGQVESTFLRDLFSWIFPIALFVGVWYFLMKRMTGQQAGFMTLGKNKSKIYMQDELNVTFQDVAGVDEAKQELVEVIEFLKAPTRFTQIGGKMPKGVLLVGPPGTGKTLLAKAVAGESHVPFFSLSGSEFVEMFVGLGAARVRDLFVQAKQKAPCIIFIDELDALGKARGVGSFGGHDEREQTLNQLLVEMDGFEGNEGIIIIAATNRPDVLDPALLRPGRFDRQVVVPLPDVKGRLEILKVHTRNIPVDESVNLDKIARGAPGFSGADLANLVNEAALLAARKSKTKVENSDLEAAKDKVLMGVERKSMIISEEEKKNTAYHEAGHALVAKLTPGTDPIHKVSIIPRGRALGVTQQLPIDDKYTYSRDFLINTLRVLMGGRAAEEIALHHMTTGAGNDIERATELARKMVTLWGMSEKLGPLTYGKKEEQIFLGREISQHRDYSEMTAQRIDQEVKDIVMEAYTNTTKLIQDNIETLHKIASALLEKETLDGKDIDEIMGIEPENFQFEGEKQ